LLLVCGGLVLQALVPGTGAVTLTFALAATQH
jgi:hypothetical protein